MYIRPRGALDEHAALIEILKNEGLRVLDVRDLLQGAIENARRIR